MGFPEWAFKHKKNVSLVTQIGHKLKSTVELGLALKNIYDTGRVIYAGAAAAAPYIGELALLAGL
jgi:hypothetical protein